MGNEAKILVIDDVPANIQVIGELLRGRYELLVATDALRALEIAKNEKPDLVLLDIMMPGMDGITLCRELKGQEATGEIPVIFITALTGEDDIVRGFEAGGVDYITKPFNPRELMARVNTHCELVRARKALEIYAESMEEVGQQLFARTRELNEMVERLNISVRTDALTGLANRMHIHERMKEEVARLKRGGNDFSLIIADIDHFKNVNDTRGHECGDLVLKTLSRIMSEMIREQDVLSRWGGEEFLFLLPQTDIRGATVMAEKLRECVEKTGIEYMGEVFSVTITLGVADFDPDLGIDGSIRKADDALYEGKRGGRNRVVSGR